MNMMNLVYTHPETNGKLYQAGYKEIPHDLKKAGIYKVIFAAVECPPLNHHQGAHLVHVPLDDKMAMSAKEYAYTLGAAMSVGCQLAIDILRGKSVISSCAAGLNRSSLCSAFALKTLTPMTNTEVVNLLRKQRNPSCLCNSTFEKMLKFYIKAA